jgi:methyl-accepting chemotaxis protein
MSNEAEILRERLKFIGFTQEDAAALREFKPTLEANVGRILTKFYAHIENYPQLMAMFRGQMGVDHARTEQAKHWRTLFGTGFDTDYVARARRIGSTHEKIGLEPRWYIAGYALAMGELMALLFEMYRWKPQKGSAVARAIVKAVMLDIDYAITIYIDEGAVKAVAKFAQKLGTIADGFETGVMKTVDGVGSSAGSMKGASQTMAAAAEETQRQAAAVAAAAQEASSNVQTVASAAEELSASIREISRQVTHATTIAKQAVAQADETNTLVKQLAEAGQKIGSVVNLIQAIAGQTNLLALNATIEAARAGEAGKGFAVVASEVKSLANQTAKATGDIAAQVNAIQEATKLSVDSLGRIAKTIEEISGISSGIAAAVEEQGAATQEIARNVQQAAAGTSEVSSNIAGVTQAATDTGQSALVVLQTADALTGQAGDLRSDVSDFLRRVRAS